MKTVMIGASDPEMERVSRLFKQAGYEVVQATINGAPVRGGDAYSPRIDQNQSREGGWVVVEAQPLPGDVVIDHHRPGDPGYGRPPSEFWEASSLGQAYAFVAWVPDEDAVLAAASDHCPAAAYAGQCPGIEPDRLMRWRIEQRAAFQGRPPEEILADVARAVEAIASAPVLCLSTGRDAEGRCLDCRGHDWLDEGWGGCTCPVVRDLRDRYIPEVPEASLRTGKAVLVQGLPDPDGRTKVNILGDADGAAVRAFMGRWGPFNGLADIYGDPRRGFAGGYK